MWTPSLLKILVPLLVTQGIYDENKYTKFYDAIWAVESSRQTNPPDGDGGKSIGPYQIQEAYYKDAKEFMPEEIDFEYQDCRDMQCAEAVIRVYMLRYAREAWKDHDFQTLARIHNGGPRGHKKKSTIPYWNKVQKVLQAKKGNQE